MIKAEHITVRTEGKVILDDVSLEVPAGELHVVFGKNGSGKSTLLSALMGVPLPEMTGSVELAGEDVTAMPVDERVRRGMFLAMQSPVALGGVSHASLLMAALKSRGDDIRPEEMLVKFRAAASEAGMPEGILTREVNTGASGGERKRAELFHMFVLTPKVALLDEIDSGLDIAAVQEVARMVASYKRSDRTMVVVTHNLGFLEMLPVDRVHLMEGGKITGSGGLEIVRKIAEQGFDAEA